MVTLGEARQSRSQNNDCEGAELNDGKTSETQHKATKYCRATTVEHARAVKQQRKEMSNGECKERKGCNDWKTRNAQGARTLWHDSRRGKLDRGVIDPASPLCGNHRSGNRCCLPWTCLSYWAPACFVKRSRVLLMTKSLSKHQGAAAAWPPAGGKRFSPSLPIAQPTNIRERLSPKPLVIDESSLQLPQMHLRFGLPGPKKTENGVGVYFRGPKFLQP